MAERYSFMKCNMNKTTNNMANVLCDAIDLDIEMATVAAKKFTTLDMKL